MRYDHNQLTKWVAGRPSHSISPEGIGHSCCPDFSCCRPELMVSWQIRQAYLVSSPEVRRRFHVAFVAALGLARVEVAEYVAAAQWN